ncbi:hypothetical protein Sgly_2678 [Syntrophobotulus glycolicus DSM 8271]|uniref:Uncharacterized protein n=1 Tax=Syntrophobotulus glycolicus (strain DSM 8271 / FlGlyR) TaxID=645991 RepID=F0SX91_SYNGF|nr:hypothetical protein [Syntrophobotulus glycolicus]ADY56951.1 hypothetical protein Sgly_2678 [Syntrophobotulus glycolicus DSM 8271]
MLTKAYSPEQAGFGKLEDGRDVVILYVKEFAEQIAGVKNSGLSKYTYNWFSTENGDSYVVQFKWDNGVDMAVRFNSQHFKLIAHFMEPRDMIITAKPISDLVSAAQEKNTDFLEFDEVLTFSGVTFSLAGANKFPH